MAVQGQKNNTNLLIFFSISLGLFLGAMTFIILEKISYNFDNTQIESDLREYKRKQIAQSIIIDRQGETLIEIENRLYEIEQKIK